MKALLINPVDKKIVSTTWLGTEKTLAKSLKSRNSRFRIVAMPDGNWLYANQDADDKHGEFYLPSQKAPIFGIALVVGKMGADKLYQDATISLEELVELVNWA